MADIIDIDDAREVAVASKFGIRPFRAKDIAPMVRIITKIGLREFAQVISPENIKALVGRAEDGKPQADIVGIGLMLDVAAVVGENFDKVEGDLFAFMASMSGLKVQGVGDLSLADTFDLLYAIFTASDFSDFFKRARALLAK
ncbi:MAG: hypothetical protein RSN88_10820 [Gordonibacter sp.]|uniref:hypothetical protein n=1 Tax=Gordonibacter sp. TaxID=1968902 RepID=UPI002FC7367D